MQWLVKAADWWRRHNHPFESFLWHKAKENGPEYAARYEKDYGASLPSIRRAIVEMTLTAVVWSQGSEALYGTGYNHKL